MSPASPRSAGSTAAAALLAVALVLVVGGPPQSARGDTITAHLVISEIVTGGASASDELIELYNPTATALPLEGLELVYVTASGATVSRRAAWELGAPTLAPGRHLLVANELGAYAVIADALYASGMASTGGSVALRIQGAGSAIDAVGWGNAASSWLEGLVAAAPPAGSSLERRPGGALGSTVDTDINAADFLVRSVPEPQNTGSPPVPDPAATPPPSPIPTASPPPPSPTPEPTADPTSTPSPQPGAISIAAARTLPDATVALVEGVALSGSDFTDGGGYVADGSGGIAVIVTGAVFARGEHLRLSGTIDDRFSQRTLRVEADLVRIGTGAEPAPQAEATGSVGESVEGELVRVTGDLAGAGTTLTTGVAFDLDDGSGPIRLVVSTTSGIDTSGWKSGTHLDLVGVVGQRDSTGSGISGYRVQPRDSGDIVAVSAPASPTPQPSGSGGPDPSGSPDPSGDVITIAAARELPKNTRATVRGTVTLPTGVVDEQTAALQDASGAIVLRLGDEAGTLARGDLVEVAAVRSTKSGMETLRVTTPPVRVGTGSEPAPRELRTGDAGEAHEARLVVARGAIVASPRRSSTGSVSFDIDDGSGPLRVAVAASLGMEGSSLFAGAWVEIAGVLGQDTTGAQPLRGYRVWPRALADVRVVATPTGAAAQRNADEGGAPGGGPASAGLDAVGAEAEAGLRIGATLVSGAWPEIGLGGLLWDGTRLAGLDPSAAATIDAALGGRRAPVALELSGLRATGVAVDLGLPMVRLGEASDAILPASSPVAPPSTELPSKNDPPRWVAVVGKLEGRGAARMLRLPSGPLAVDLRCDANASVPAGVIGLVGIATADPARIVVGCDGVRAAPALDRPGAHDSRPGGESGEAALAGLAGDASDAGTQAPVLPAALLGVAAFALVGGAFVARRLGNDEPGPDGDDDAVVEGADEEGSPPTLTLVPLPRERAP